MQQTKASAPGSIRPPATRYVPPDLILAVDAIGEVGKRLYPSEWLDTDLEAIAVSPGAGPSKLLGDLASKLRTDLTSDWKQPAADSMAARNRFEGAHKGLLDALSTGKVQAFVLLDNGGRVGIHRNAWAKVGADRILDLQRDKSRWQCPGYGKFETTIYSDIAEGSPVILRTDLGAWLAAEILTKPEHAVLQANTAMPAACIEHVSIPNAQTTEPALTTEVKTVARGSSIALKRSVGRPPNSHLTEPQRRSIEYELQAAGAELPASYVNGKIKWGRSAKVIAQKVRKSPRTIQEWRNREDYISEVKRQLIAPGALARK